MSPAGSEEAQPDDVRAAEGEADGIDLWRSLLRPSAIALVGAGNDPMTNSGLALDLLRRHGFRGRLYPVNPVRRQVQEVQAWPDLASLPSPVDLALIVSEGDAAIDAVEACGHAGVPLAIVQSTLGGEATDAGVARRERLLLTARHHGVRVLGPGSAGVVVPATGLALTSELALAAQPMRDGRLMALCHGESTMGALFSRAAAHGVGFAAMVGVGGVDLALGDIGGAAVDDPGIDAFLLLMQEIRNPAALARFAAAAHAAGKPIVAHKLRRFGSGAPRGADDAVDTFFRAHGILRVDQFDTLIEIAPMMARRVPGKGRAAALVSTAPGSAAIVADRLAGLGVAVDGLDDLARDRLAQEGIALAAGAVTEARAEILPAVLDEALAAPNNDFVLAVLGAAAELDPAAAVAPLAAAAQHSDKPLAALVVPESPEALRRLAAAGIAAFRTPEAAADGVRAVLDWPPPTPPSLLWEDEPPRRVAQHVMHAGQAIQIFKLLGIPIPTMLWLRRDAALPKALPFPPPYVVKILSPDIEHRSEVGGVALGLETLTAVQLAAGHVVR
ncbi:MAG: CoA-binding protein, partial [Rhodospirillaceae bacterium]|nr:CoA-binding protein [Rhodospirillaceae bacterium]